MNLKKLVITGAAAALIGSVGFAPNAMADQEDVIRIDGVGAITTDQESNVDVDGEEDGIPSELDERLDGWAGVDDENGVCANSHGSRGNPDEADEDIDGENAEASCNEDLVAALAEG